MHAHLVIFQESIPMDSCYLLWISSIIVLWNRYVWHLINVWWTIDLQMPWPSMLIYVLLFMLDSSNYYSSYYFLADMSCPWLLQLYLFVRYSRTKSCILKCQSMEVAPLRLHVRNLQSFSKRLTSLHSDSLLLCILAKCYKTIFSILEEDIFEVNYLKDLLLYCYYGLVNCIFENHSYYSPTCVA